MKNDKNIIKSDLDSNSTLFNSILDKDEHIIKIFKPNRAKTFWNCFFVGIIFWIFGALWLGALIGGGIFGTDVLLENGEIETEMNMLAFGISTLITFVVLVLISFICCYLSYKKTWFAYTNKRIVIRKGIIGVDYKSLDMSMIGAVSVNVSVLDKIVCKNTGTILFGSMASPIGNAVFKFSNIENPYDVYKEIKSFIDDTKLSKESNI